MQDISAAYWIRQHLDDDDEGREHNQDSQRVAKTLVTPVGVEFPRIAYRSEKVMSRH